MTDLRIVGWNIRAGGGRRVAAIAAQLASWSPDIVALSEFRATPPSRELAAALRALGLTHQRTTADPREPQANALLLAARWPLRPLALRRAPREPRRWLLGSVAVPDGLGGALAVGALHAPNFATGRKLPYLDALRDVVLRWRGGPGLLVGDTNTGRMQVDEQSRVFDRRHHEWMEAMHRDWPDAFRQRHGDAAQAFTWYSPNGGNGFRLDEAFLEPRLVRRLLEVRHEWGHDGAIPGRREALSDHSALILDFAGAPP